MSQSGDVLKSSPPSGVTTRLSQEKNNLGNSWACPQGLVLVCLYVLWLDLTARLEGRPRTAFLC